MRSSPTINSSMELSAKRNCLNVNSSENYVTENESELNVEKVIKRFEKVSGRHKNKKGLKK